MSSEYISLDEALKISFSSMAFADMAIDCADGMVPVHRSVLAAASTFLRPILKEYNAVESNRIFIPDVKVETMKQVLSLIYTGSAYSTDISQIQEVVTAAKLLGVQMEGWEVVNVVVVKSASPKVVPTPAPASEPEIELLSSSSSDEDNNADTTSDEKLEKLVSEMKQVRKTSGMIQKSRVRNTVTSATANVIGEMLESGQLQLTPGPAHRVNGGVGTLGPVVPVPRLRLRNPNPIHGISKLNGRSVINPGVGMVRVHSVPRPRIAFQNIPYASPEYELVEEDVEEVYTMTPDEIQEGYLVASQKDHAYANGPARRARVLKLRVRSGADSELGYDV